MLISKSALAAYESRELNSYSWMKSLTKEDLLADMKNFKVKPQFKTDPWLHQLVCFYIGMVEPEFLFLLDMGAGKTKLMLDLLTQAQREKKLNHGLVLVPRLVNLGTWQADAEIHSDLGVNICSGSIEEKYERLLNPVGEVSLIDYHGLQLAMSTRLGKSKTKGKLVRDDRKIAALQKVYNRFVLDESHKTKNSDTLRHSILNQLFKKADSVYATTGTLFGSNVEDIYTQFHLIDGGATFGNTIGMFRACYMREVADYWAGSKWEFDKRRARQLFRALQHRSIRYSEHEFSDLPDRVEVKMPVKMAAEQLEHYNRAVEGVIQTNGNLKELEGAWIRMRQIVAGFLSWKDAYGDHTLNFKENPKLDLIEKIVTESGDSKVVISHEYTNSGKLITERLASMGVKFEWLYGGTKDPINCVRRFISEPDKKVFVMNSESGGTGTDGLQKVAKYLVFYESPCSPITRRQTVKRVHRAGQTKRTYIYDLVAEKSVDYGILKQLEAGSDLHSSIVDGKSKDSHRIKSLLLGE